jgi:hypothetical protein
MHHFQSEPAKKLSCLLEELTTEREFTIEKEFTTAILTIK